MTEKVNHYSIGTWVGPWEQLKSLWSVVTTRIKPDYQLDQFGDVATSFFGIGGIQGARIAIRWARNPKLRKFSDGHMFQAPLLADEEFMDSCPEGSLGHGYMEFMRFWKPIYDKESSGGVYGKIWQSGETFSKISTTQVKDHDGKGGNTRAIVSSKYIDYYLTNPNVHPDLKKDVEEIGLSRALRIRVGDRLMGIHDIYHPLLNCGRDQIGEMIILCWNAIDSGFTGLYVITWLTCLRESWIHKTLEPFRIRRDALNDAKQSANLMDVDYEQALQEDLPTLKKRLRIKDNKRYMDFCGVKHWNNYPKNKYKSSRWDDKSL